MINTQCINWRSIRFTRNNISYRLLIEISLFVIERELMNTDKGRHRLLEFNKKDMNRLFEKFVLEYYRRHHPKLRPAASKVEWNTDGEKCGLLPDMKADIFLYFKDRKFIIDTKYYSEIAVANMGITSLRYGHLWSISQIAGCLFDYFFRYRLPFSFPL